MSPEVNQKKTDHITSKKKKEIPTKYWLEIHCQHGGKPQTILSGGETQCDLLCTVIVLAHW